MSRGTFKFFGAVVGSTAFGFFAAQPPAVANTSAGGNTASSRAMFDSMDADGDGRVSEAEHADGARKMFATMDANGDGRVTATEMTAAHEKVTGKRTTKDDLPATEKIAAIDTNGDGVLSAEEHEAGSKLMFERMDADHDGFLTWSEFSAGHASLTRKPASKK